MIDTEILQDILTDHKLVNTQKEELEKTILLLNKSDEIDNMYLDMCKEVNHYIKLKEQGRLIKLPCKVGDTVYFIKSAFSFSKEPMEKEVSSIHIHRSCTMIDCGDRRFDPDNIGKTVFLTHEEAEKVLAKSEVSE